MKRSILLGLYFLLFLPFLCMGQKYKHVPLEAGPSQKVHKKSPSPELHLDFPNLNKIPYYRNSRQLAAIQKLEKRKRYDQVLPLLEKYVHNFGVENFYKDTRLLWRLGQLAERQGELEKAKALYRLVLKHHRSDVRRVASYYDSLEQNTKDYYVPLDYYYELVEYRKSVTTFKPPKGVYVNMGKAINSSYADYGPTLSDTNATLIFTSKRHIHGLKDRSNEDLFYSRQINGFWEEAQPFGKPVNSIYNEGSAYLSRDGHTLFFTRCEARDSYGNCDIYTATKQPDGNWGQIKNLGSNVNSEAWDSQPTLSANEDTLYFSSDRLGGFGLSDIYYSYKTKSGDWAKAQNMGPVINTRDSEVSPFYHPLYQVLYFSSRGQLNNFGDFDIYKTYKVQGHWQEPRNIGPLVNGRGSEYYFTIDAASKNLYYARSEADDIENLDLFSFPLPMEAHPLAVTKVVGMLTDSVTQKPLSGVISVIDLDNGIEISSKYIRPDGSFEFNLIDNSNYLLLIQSPDFFTIEKQLQLQQDTSVQVMTTVIDYSIPLVFKNIEFDQNQSSIKEDMKPVLDEVALFLMDHPTYRLQIAGYTDGFGDPNFNLSLSQDRADAIKRYIERQIGIPGTDSRVEAIGYGSTRPLREEKTEEDRRINRRVEFKIIKPDKGQF
ncbi:outer membrane protein OmpA-like peptidoglycan-associated protein [Pontibacter ummariensis]|uniref:Outer membrane protein OmpA n=1 Tax=Pontibacter ummariensis TaxID=1610492 RepID=A0A239E627_9BACT|nr:OmpA family protein [Pontibacter ummariensis]PRY13102.1 outer membrane protein OmpA-like peptidoglycan-associated protein [Pontibacter ummariensis]SNS40106.1 Outer membrane protein OmpA [Pontibacter ummariensis]